MAQQLSIELQVRLNILTRLLRWLKRSSIGRLLRRLLPMILQLSLDVNILVRAYRVGFDTIYFNQQLQTDLKCVRPKLVNSLNARMSRHMRTCRFCLLVGHESCVCSRH